MSKTTEMLLEIVTPQGIFLSQKVTFIKAPGVKGEFGILANHISFYLFLNDGIIEYDAGTRKHISIGSGILECVRNKIVVMTKSAELQD